MEEQGTGSSGLVRDRPELPEHCQERSGKLAHLGCELVRSAPTEGGPYGPTGKMEGRVGKIRASQVAARSIPEHC